MSDRVGRGQTEMFQPPGYRQQLSMGRRGGFFHHNSMGRRGGFFHHNMPGPSSGYNVSPQHPPINTTYNLQVTDSNYRSMRKKKNSRGGFFHHNMPGPSSGYNVSPQHTPINTTYKLNEKLPPESREREYKEAQGQFMKHNLHATVARYVCGFLNSQVEGKLILGVTDKCEVIGVNNRYEDSDKQTIDAAIKGLRPHVFPQDYHLAFCDILDSDGNKINDLSVVELTVYKKDNLTSLYETSKHECWQRRDASTEEMTPQQIQDWWRQKTNHSNNQDKKEMENLRSNLRGKENQLRDQGARLRDLESQVHRTENDVTNMQSKCDRMEEDIGKKDEEIQRLREENKDLKEQVQEKDTEKSEAASSSVHRELQDIKNMLAKKNQSKVCTIS